MDCLTPSPPCQCWNTLRWHCHVVTTLKRWEGVEMWKLEIERKAHDVWRNGSFSGSVSTAFVHDCRYVTFLQATCCTTMGDLVSERTWVWLASRELRQIFRIAWECLSGSHNGFWSFLIEGMSFLQLNHFEAHIRLFNIIRRQWGGKRIWKLITRKLPAKRLTRNPQQAQVTSQ